MILRAVIAVVLIGLSALAGSYYARHAVRAQTSARTFVHNGPWRTDATLASPDSSPQIRAYLAMTGLFGLPIEETAYYELDRTDEGAQIDASGIYEIRGRDMPARWWSITVYDHDNFLTPNAYERYSVKGTEVAREADGSFRIRLSRDPQEGDWIPLGDGHDMIVLLRLYNPDPELANQLATVALPSVTRIGDAP